MRFWIAGLMALVVAASGCVSKRNTATFSAPPETGKSSPVVSLANSPAAPNKVQPNPEAKSKLIVTPENLLVGSVSTYNTAGRFVVLDFPVGKMPKLDQLLFVYRQGLKVGEVRITGPERDHNTVADLISGEAQKGDEVRDK